MAESDHSRDGMIALVPTAGNATRLAVEGGELADDLHTTLLYLGDITDLTEEAVGLIMSAVGEVVDEDPVPVVADGFNVSLFNPHSDERETCITLGLSGTSLDKLHQRIRERVMQSIASQSYEIPEQHEPWIPHVTLAYSDDHSLVEQLADRTGEITFDRVRLALGEDVYDLFLTPMDFEDESTEDDVAVTEVDVDAEDELWAAGILRAEVDRRTTMEYNDRGGEEMAVDTETEADATEIDVAEGTAEPGAWSGILIVEGVESGDGRMFAEGSLRSAPLPLPLMWQRQTDEGHKTAVQAGRIDELWREGNEIWGAGVFDLEGDDGQEAYRQVKDKFLRGVSGDVDSVKDSDVELVFPKTMGSDDDELADLFSAPELTIFHRGRLRGATLVQFPAFVEASISLDGAGLPDSVIEVDAGSDAEFSTIDIVERVEANVEVEPLQVTASDDDETVGHIAQRDELTACGCTDEAPPREWFENPQLSGPTPLTVTEDGRIYGHAAVWGTCHTGFAGTCVTPPRERGHEYYLLGETLCADGSTVATGTITLGTGHAATGGRITGPQAIDHYDHTGTAVADVATGEDKHGLWFAGSLRPELSPYKLRALRAAKLSGDWRKFGNGLRLIALLAVNVPGFPVPRVKAGARSGRQVSLVAAGVNPYTTRDSARLAEHEAMLSIVASLKKRVGRDDRSRMVELRNRVGR